MTEHAKNVINHLPITNSSYEPAWELLIEKYENRRTIFTNAFQDLRDFQTPPKENIDSLQKLNSTIQETIQILKIIGRDVNAIVSIIAHLAIEKQSIETRKETRKEVKNQLLEMSSFQRYLMF